MKTHKNQIDPMPLNKSNSTQVSSNQLKIHPNLELLVKKHLHANYQLPINSEQEKQFDIARNWQQHLNKPFMIDCGCGTGQSTVQLAEKFPEHLIIGIDQSQKRLETSKEYLVSHDNLIFVQAHIEEFLLLCQQLQWFPCYQYHFYPNPWPKKKHIIRRWHGHPIFPTLLQICPHLELRTNWEIYAKEFSQSLTIMGIEHNMETIIPERPISRFEQKYLNSGHCLYQIQTTEYIPT